MQELYDIDGNKVENVLTKEEHEAQIQEATKKALDEAQKSGTVVPKETVTALQTELDKAKADLEKLSKKDYNFKNLEEARNAAEARVKEVEEKLGKEIENVKGSIASKEITGAISKLADGDAELEKKIKFQYDRIVRLDDTEEERNKKLADAFTLASGRKPSASMIDGVVNLRGAVDSGQVERVTGPVRPELVPLASKLGLSQKDIDKYGAK